MSENAINVGEQPVAIRLLRGGRSGTNTSGLASTTKIFRGFTNRFSLLVKSTVAQLNIFQPASSWASSANSVSTKKTTGGISIPAARARRRTQDLVWCQD